MSMDDNIIWLALCNAEVKKHGFSIDSSIVEVFINKKLFYMLNSLKYEQVYDILVYTLSLSRLSL